MTGTTINRYALSDNTLPAGFRLMELKYCELCGVPFAREFAPTRVVGKDTVRLGGSILCWDKEIELRRGQGLRYCRACVGRELTPDLKADEAYRDQFPGSERQMRTRYQGPKYDGTLSPDNRHLNPRKEGKAWVGASMADKPKRKRDVPEEIAAWKAKVMEAFVADGRLTLEQLQDFVPRCYTPTQAYHKLRYFGLRIRRVGQGFYELPGTSPIYVAPPRVLTQDEINKEKAVALYRERRAMLPVASELGLSYGAVRRYCRGIALSPGAETAVSGGRAVALPLSAPGDEALPAKFDDAFVERKLREFREDANA